MRTRQVELEKKISCLFSGGIWGQNYVGQNKRLKRGSPCFKNLKKNWLQFLNFRWGIAPNCPAVIPPLCLFYLIHKVVISEEKNFDIFRERSPLWVKVYQILFFIHIWHFVTLKCKEFMAKVSLAYP
jgi:hypothetical protein